MPATTRFTRLSRVLTAVALTAGPLAAHAAEPSAPDRLPAEVVGVTGSGDQLSLRIRRDQADLTLNLGDEYRDGWRLYAVTAATATLEKDGARREVGLNPAGALAVRASEEPAAIVVTISDAEDLAAAIASRRWDGQPQPGLTLAETERRVILAARGDRILRARSLPVGGSNQIAVLGGADGAELQRLYERVQQAMYQDRLTVWNQFGPVSFYVPAGGSLDEGRRSVGLLGVPVGLSSVTDASGGRTYTLVPPVAPLPMIPTPGLR